MALKYLYKCNPKVGTAAGVTAFNRYTWPDGSMLLWGNDIMAIDRVRFHLDQDGLLADLGAVRLTDPEASAEQRNPSIRLPEARLPEYRWEQPDYSKDDGEEDAEEADAAQRENSGTETEEETDGAREEPES